MNPAVERIWALVSGLPEGLRMRRLLMVWQVFIDDSGNAPDQDRFVLGALIAPIGSWLKFSTE